MKSMRLIILLVLMLMGIVRNSMAQDTLRWKSMHSLLNYATKTLKSNHPSLRFCKYHLTSPDGNVYDWYGNNDERDSIQNFPYYLNAVKDIQLSNFDSTEENPVTLQRLQKEMVPRQQKGYTPLSFTFIEYEDFKDSTIYLQRIGWSDNHFTETVVAGYNPFKKKRLFTASALNHILKIPGGNFILDDDLILSNIADQVDSIYVNFGNGQGFKHIQKGQSYLINYETEGLKNCVMKIKSSFGYFSSIFQIFDSTVTGGNAWQQKIASSCTTDPDSTRDISANSGLIEGKYGIYFANCNTAKKMRKPYIIAVGYNPGEGMQLEKFALQNNDITIGLNGTVLSLPVTYGWRGTYYDLYNGGWNKYLSENETNNTGEGCDNGNKYLDRLREEGYDVVILMNTDGRDKIQRNAALLEKLIIRLNEHKMANGFYFENVVSGYSAGGLASRLCLARMEEKYRLGTGVHPHTKLWVNFEGENQGANVPLSFQYLVDFHANPAHTLPTFFGYLNILQVLADVVNIQAAGIVQTFIYGPAAKQINLFAPQNPSGPSPERSTLLSDFTNITGNSSEYPDYTRRVAVSQGSSKGSQVPHTSSTAFQSQLKFNPFGDSYTETDCNGSYTVYRPVSIKTSRARWWSSNNNQNIFDGDVYINANWTYMKRQCNTWFGGCNCIGPFIWAGQVNNVASQHIAKPSNPPNYDDVPASNLASHIELYKGSAFAFYNNWFAGNSSASNDPKTHALAPTTSVLDLKTLTNGNFTSPAGNGGLGLMNINNNNGLNPHPNSRFGFPHLVSSTPYIITPFDGIYAIGTNNGVDINNNTRPDNQYHVEDPQTMIGDYLANVEVAPVNLYLSNRTVGSSASDYSGYTSGFTAEFEARNRIIAGKYTTNGIDNIYSEYTNQNYLTPSGELKVAIGSKAIFHCGTQIDFLPGFEAQQGAEMASYIQVYNSNCPNILNKTSNPTTYNTVYNNAEDKNPVMSETSAGQTLRVYPNPSQGHLTIINPSEKDAYDLAIYDLSGKMIYKSVKASSQAGDLDLTILENGIYLMLIDDQKFKLIINK